MRFAKSIVSGALAGTALLGSGCVSLFDPPPVVAEVDLSRYAGKWFEIASYPTAFQAGCTGTTAEYGLRDDGSVSVLNTCFLDSLDGERNTIQGSARVADAAEPAKLLVTFGGFFEAPYWIIGLDEQYEWAIVSDPTRSFLWILSRTPSLDDATFDAILMQVTELGYDTSRLRLTTQAAE